MPTQEVKKQSDAKVKILAYPVMFVLAVGLAVRFSAFSSPSGPDTNVHVATFEPSGLTDRASNITVKFSNEMVPADSLDRPVLNPPMRFDPPLAGIARWIETDVLRFYPDEQLAPATEYQVKVSSKGSFIKGNRIKEKRTFNFFTPYLQVEQTSHRTVPVRELPSHVRMVISLDFNYAVNLGQLEKKLKIKGGKRAEKSRLSFEVMKGPESGRDKTGAAPSRHDTPPEGFSKSCEIVTEPFKMTVERQEYRLYLKRGLECENCGSSLQDEFTYTIRLSRKEPLVVRRVAARGAGTSFNVLVHLSSEIDANEVRDYVSVEPEVEFALESMGGRLLLRGHFRPGETYTVRLDEGIPALSGAVLERGFSSKVQVPNLPPSIKFTSRGVFLPKEGSGNIEVQTLNIDQLVVEVEQVFENNLLYFLTGRYGSRYRSGRGLDALGRRIFFKEKELQHSPNEALLTTIDLGSIIGDTTRGIFVVSARHKQQRWVADSRQVMLTDIGISARMADNYLLVWAHSLVDTKPLPKAPVTLISKNNQVLVVGETDSRGIVIFDDLKSYTEEFQPYVITVTREGDLAYLRFSDCLLPTSDFDVSGRPYLVSGYESFVYLDRGIYRPGDTAHIVSIVRGADGRLPPEFPFLLTIRDPQGRKFKTFRMTSGKTSLAAIDFAVPAFASTGSYTVTASIGDDYEIGRTDFLVEEFMPDRIKVTLTTARNVYRAGDNIEMEVLAKFLFGPPARGNRVTGSITIEQDVFCPSGWSEYTFSACGRKYAQNEIRLPDTLLDDSGGYTYEYQLPESIKAPSVLKALLSVAVSEHGGRTVGAYKELMIHPYERYLGLRLKLDGYAKPGQPVEADLVSLNTKGKPTSAQQVQVRFYRVIYHSLLRRDRQGYYRYVSERTTLLLDSAAVTIPEHGAAVSFVPPDYGEYEIEASDGTEGHAASVRFYASGWGYAPWSMANPDQIELDLDRTEYTLGTTARVQVRAPFAGRLLLTVERERVLDIITVDMKENTAEIDLPVKKDYFPNAYLAATLIRPARLVEKHSPARAFGIAPLKLSAVGKKLPVTIEAPLVIKPQSAVSVHLAVGQPGITELTVAMVDAGILQLTDFITPDPLRFFYGQKRPHLKHYDMCSFIYPDVGRAQSHLSPAGDRKFAQARKRHLIPITAHRVKPVALWSGVVQTDQDGHATVTFEVPQFNGKLVVMAVVAREDQFGSVSREMIVRDNIVMQESFPRFTAPNDMVDGLVSIFNNTGQAATIAVRLDLDGPAELLSDATQTIKLANKGEGDIIFRMKAALKPGRITCRLTASSGSDSSWVRFELPNRPAQPLKTISGSGVVTKERPTTFTLPGDWLEGTDKYVIRTSSLAAVAFARNIQYLLAYPYGCLEQTTSRLFPLLYFNGLAKFVQPEIFGGGGPDYFVQEGIVKLTSMGLSDGSFAFWPGGTRRHHWSTVYASHFLVEARQAGYFVDESFYEKVLGNVKKIARGKVRNDIDESQRIYAAFVLVKAGKLENRVITYLKKLNPEGLPVYSRFQLAGVLALAGEIEFARSLIPFEIQPDLFEPETGGNFNSGVRSNALLLDVLMEVEPDNPSVAALAKSLMEQARIGRWYTTQANAFALMALGKFFKGKANLSFTGTVHITGDSTYRIDTACFMLQRKNLAKKEVTISIDGEGTCFYFWQASGVSSSHAAEEFDRGIRVRRQYLEEDGEPLDLQNVTLGNRVICRITAEAKDKTLYNVVINDLIPVGFEIENPRLKTTPALSWIADAGHRIDYQDIRDDRLLLFADLRVGKPLEFYYTLRAISAGEFVIPPVAAECMYNPLIAGSASSGRVTITGTEGE